MTTEKVRAGKEQTLRCMPSCHPGCHMTYSRMIEVQALMLAAFIRGQPPRYIGLTIR